MRSNFAVQVPVVDLLVKLRANRESHAALYARAMVGYKHDALTELRQRMAKIENGAEFDLHFRLPTPVTQTAEYDRVIAMLEMATDKEIQLNEEQFECYVQDHWSWSDQVDLSNTRYLR